MLYIATAFDTIVPVEGYLKVLPFKIKWSSNKIINGVNLAKFQYAPSQNTD